MSHNCCSDSSTPARPLTSKCLAGATVTLVIVQILSTLFLNLEAQKRAESLYGGAENFKIAGQFQSIQFDGLRAQMAKNPNFLENYKKQVAGQAGSDAQAPADESKTVKVMTEEQKKKLVSDLRTHGPKDARYLVVEYTDPECPYCKRHFQAGTLESFAKNHADVALGLKLYPLPFHAHAKAASTAIMCAGELKGDDAYFAFVKGVFEKSGSNGQINLDDMPVIAKEVGLDAKKFAPCAASEKFNTTFDTWTAEGQSFGIQGTPGNLIVDLKTGKYILLPGAYPLEAFEAAYNTLSSAQ